jgi:hypothetical protein
MSPSTNTEDASVVTLAANYLDVSEFEVFCASYRSWYSDEGSEALLERQFGEYLKHGDVPFWVRHFSRERLSKAHDDGRLRSGLLSELAMVMLLPAPAASRTVDACTSTLIA